MKPIPTDKLFATVNEFLADKPFLVAAACVFQLIICVMAVQKIYRHLRGPHQGIYGAGIFIPYGMNNFYPPNWLGYHNTRYWKRLPRHGRLIRLNRDFGVFRDKSNVWKSEGCCFKHYIVAATRRKKI